MEIDEYNTIIDSNQLVYVLLGIMVIVIIVVLIIILVRKRPIKKIEKIETNKSENEINKKD